MGSTPSRFEQARAGRGRARLVALPEGVLLVDCRPVWTRRGIAKLVIVSLLVAVAIGIFARLAGPAGSLLAFVGMLWLSPWLALTAGGNLPRKLRVSFEVVRHRWRRQAARRRLRHTAVAAGSLGAVAGAPIRVLGRVLDGPGFVSASGRQNCVLACYAGVLGGRGNRPGQVEVHAVPSCLMLVGHDVVEVALARARYLECHLPVVRHLHEQTIAVGDEIEVVGTVVRTVDQSNGGYRTPGLKLMMAGEDRRPLVLCRSPA
jgi:hypothetical protein